jgi:hypothetical protein
VGRKKLFYLSILALVTGILLFTGCKIEISVPEGGRVISKSGDYLCQSGQVCIIDIYDLFFDEEFIGEPAPGFTFAEWKKVDRGFCANKTTPCRIVSAWAQIHEIFMELLESDDIFYLEPVFANTWSQVGEDILGSGRSGLSVSMSADGNRLAIGSPGYNGGLTDVYDVGQVRVFKWSDNGWRQLGQDIDGEAGGDRFGTSVSLSSNGNKLAVGAIWVAENGARSGQVQVYTWSGTTWQQLGKSINGETAMDSSGTSVSLSANGRRLAIGAPDNDGGGYNSGHVRIYQWVGGAWKQLGGDINGRVAGELSGHSVSLSADGNHLAIGAFYNGDNGDTAGAARVYAWSGTNWKQLGEDFHGKAPYDWFGISVSLSKTKNGTRVAIGTAQADYVQIYAWSGSKWTQHGGDINGEDTGGKFGDSVSLSADGSRLAIGDPWGRDNGYNAGQVRVYGWSGTEWQQLFRNINGATKLDNFGHSVSLSRSGARVAAGAPGTGGYTGVYELTYVKDPAPAVDPMKVYLLSPEHVEQIPQNNPATGCPYNPLAGYGLRINFDWSDAKSPAGIAGYHLRVIGRRASKPLIDTFVTNSDYLSINCGSYVINSNASSGFDWSVQAEDKSGNLGPVNNEGFFVFELCRLNNGDPCGGN